MMGRKIRFTGELFEIIPELSVFHPSLTGALLLVITQTAEKIRYLQ